VIELPLYGRHNFAGNAAYMINATRYRHPLVNGYSGFAAPDFDDTEEAMRAFPDYEALEYLHKLGVTHIVVHRTTGMERRRAEIDGSPALRLLAEENGIAIYRLADR
jgi:hypothetical protein